MYLMRRVARTQPGKAWEVANVLKKTCEAYEAAGRNPAQLYVGSELRGDADVVYVEWTQDNLNPTQMSEVPASIFADFEAMEPNLVSYDIEFYELVTPEALANQGL